MPERQQQLISKYLKKTASEAMWIGIGLGVMVGNGGNWCGVVTVGNAGALVLEAEVSATSGVTSAFA